MHASSLSPATARQASLAPLRPRATAERSCDASGSRSRASAERSCDTSGSRSSRSSKSRSSRRAARPRLSVAARAAAAEAGDSSPQSPRVAVFSAKPYVKDFLGPSLDAAFPESRYLTARLDESTAALARGCDVAVAFVNDAADAAALEILKEGGVGLVALRCAGFDCVDLEAAARLGIKVLRVPTYSPTSVAEHSVALALSLCRKIPQAHDRMRSQNYELSGLVGFQMKGKTVGIWGTGAIGTAAVGIYRGLGCRVLAYDRVPNPSARALGAKYVDSEEALLRESDVLSLHVPLNASTKHLINENSLRKLKPGAMIINVSRGGLIDTSAVLDAIDSGVVGALALDVYENEAALFFEDLSEIPFEQRRHLVDRRFQLLMSYPNVLVTPHVAFATTEALEEIARVVQQNVSAWWKWKAEGADAGVALENEIVASKN